MEKLRPVVSDVLYEIDIELAVSQRSQNHELGVPSLY
jgi:hypothetical protein